VIAITMQKLGKKFKLFSSQGGRFLEYLSMGRITRHSDFWALQDISFEIPAGTTLGILGQNGSGKSTLLSILAGVLEPSAGTFTINGKVSAILELGSGFHPEFSGRDNVYMYGSIMGLPKSEIDSRFNEILRFSELEDFIDQPLRTYSSGMVVRLAFSVAINVDAEILIIDEALAVGDAIFQHRCFRKIREMQLEGKTILYVGHDTEAVRNLCSVALLLDGGRIISQGDPNNVVNTYYSLISEREQKYSEDLNNIKGEHFNECYITDFDLIDLLKTAKIIQQTKEDIKSVEISISSLPKKVIYALPHSEFEYGISIFPDMILLFAIGIFPQSVKMMKAGVHFQIQISSDHLCETIFSKNLEPHIITGDIGWHNFEINLESYAGKFIYIRFITQKMDNSDDSWCASAWGWPKIVHLNKKNSALLSVTNKISAEKDRIEKRSEGEILYGVKGVPINYGNKKAEILNFEILDENGTKKTNFKTNESAKIEIVVRLNQNCEDGLTVGCLLRNRYTTIYGTCALWQNIKMTDMAVGQSATIEISVKLRLGEGTYSLTPAIAVVHSETDVEQLDRREDALIFTVINDKTMEGICDLDATIRILYH
jgi:ABC-type polysaccharide/polyol phosphate transport system ATPase subunit